MAKQPFVERVFDPLARGKKVRCQRLDELRQGPVGPLVRSRLVATEIAHGNRFDTFRGHSSSQIASRSSFRGRRPSRTGGAGTFAFSDSVTSALHFGMRCYLSTSRLQCVHCVDKRSQATCGN